MGKISFLAGGAVGYVFGTRAGRQRYEQIKARAAEVWRSPTVQEKASQAQGYAREKAPLVKEKAAGAAASAAAAAKEARSAAQDKARDGQQG